MCDDMRTRYDAAIKYFEEAIEEPGKIIEETDLLAEKFLLSEQRRYFITAVCAMKACRDKGLGHG